MSRRIVASALIGLTGVVTLATAVSLQSLDQGLPPLNLKEVRAEFTDRAGRSLTRSYQNKFNFSQQVKLAQMPQGLVEAFIVSEDKRFFYHSGVDWLARLHAVFQALRQLALVRGASSISEQVVRILHPRPRSLWTRWLEGFEAVRLEAHYSKEEILQFYLNQVPYGARRRGVVAAAHYYFDRDLSTLNLREQLALAVLVRAPERLNPRKNRQGLERRIDQLISRLERGDKLAGEQLQRARESGIELRIEREPIEAGHFVQYLRGDNSAVPVSNAGTIQTTLDGVLQGQIQQALRVLLRRFANNQISHGGVLVIDHESGEILAWVNDRNFFDTHAGSQIDAVTTLRQPGSTLKPFVYAQALEKGWSAATILDDSELFRAVGLGLHNYRNYSRIHHGKVRLREALGSSLNIPAVLAAEYVGRAELLRNLRNFGFESLRRSADHYGEGLALGNGEVSLFELVSAYSVLARGGRRIPIRGVTSGDFSAAPNALIISPESASIIAHILADPQARMLEFGSGGVLQFPTQTAVKTGTSGGYRDLWALGFSARFTAGVWMGNLDRLPTRGLTSSQAPAMLLRSVFALLEQRWDGAQLPLRGDLVTRTICAETGLISAKDDPGKCRRIDEIFSRRQSANAPVQRAQRLPKILVPSPGLIVARDPRIPDKFERLGLALDRSENVSSVRWYIDSVYIGEASDSKQLVSWPLSKGQHQVVADVSLLQQGKVVDFTTGPVSFVVR